MTAFDDPWEWFDPEIGRQTFVTPPQMAPVITREHIKVGMQYGILSIKRNWRSADMRAAMAKYGVETISQLHRDQATELVATLRAIHE